MRPRKYASKILFFAALLLTSGCATEVAFYKKPGQDFSAYNGLAIAGFRSDPKLADTAKGAVDMPVMLHAFMTSRGYAVIDPQRSVAELAAIAPADKELAPEVLAELGRRLKVDALLTGAVKYYGLHEETVPAMSPSSSSSTPGGRRYYTRGYDRGPADRRINPTATELQREYRVTLRLELFDVASRGVVWWGEATASGDEPTMKTYADRVLDALFKQFPISPQGQK